MEHNLHTDIQNLTKAVSGLTAAIIALTAVAAGSPPRGVAPSGTGTPSPGRKGRMNLKEPPDPLKNEAGVTTSEPALNKDEIRNLLKSVNSRDFSLATLAKFKVTTLSALDAKHYPEVAEMVRVELERQALAAADANSDPTDE
jgi:hypothetical protein